MPNLREEIEALDTVWKRTHEGPELSREEAIFFLGVFTAFISGAHKREDAIRALPRFDLVSTCECCPPYRETGKHGTLIDADALNAILDGEA